MQAICTIITKSHLHYAIALHASIKQFLPTIQMHILVVDVTSENLMADDPEIHFYDTQFIRNSKLGKKIYEKYYHKNMDHFRWSSKGVFMSSLLKTDISRLLYLDSDLYFFSDPSFLFQQLEYDNILLSPHFRCTDPSLNRDDFGRSNTHGLFNGGFLGAHKKGIQALEWWADTCYKVCTKNIKKGYYQDQSHLNLLPILFENTGIIRNRGCNVANWNRTGSPRSVVNGELMLNGKDRLVFIHFTNDTIKGAYNGEDPLLEPYVNRYKESVKAFAKDVEVKQNPSF